ncbi:LysR family transcriptional regulator [Piscinibacter sakaiensis]|uniref:Transcriptional regulator, LysR family n=1 Tax=Piscinibacter sakaiensis TaxID=1547922 RepID=A0A0K8P6X3_PISS1|nr:LysR substrate-binding domain-containing protein [Piscinibacter sakaiensis]GAP38367.1 transcriptional regulator, LysR family [Piscinibacter sakaiensis]
MFDLELLRTFVCVVDERSFTRGGARVHRSQSTVSQQIRRLEEALGQPLLQRDRSGRDVRPTERGELLAHYARRLLALAQEAHERVGAPLPPAVVRLGVPEDVDARRLASVLAGFAQRQPAVRLETLSGMSSELNRALVADALDLALLKREPGSGPCLAAWPEALAWVGPAGAPAPVGEAGRPLPLALFPPGCIYRQRALRWLDGRERPWRLAFASQSLAGIQAAVASGLGLSVLPLTALLPEHRVLGIDEGFEAPPATELALVAGGPVSAGARALADHLIEAFGT